ncbi:uncharacterized protein K460DRAFT_411588 [Cucurbitaria berberidis CBS 394.84]|uniref:Uncharacterized protein n=1 Tax=Cucurbitaria berberidis CBS 394.84 TaxID=1168544 RepID=A0A9P4GNJ8_9PLEO|nr:uncharacterized protein K460DRAFT_411588 [Cucurbitaria berberidis CBS 394.84]KAF1849763.1 hypothetical protein K460DRAFT_411588 [Cucurbitaria berberidis CBS 394.84]
MSIGVDKRHTAPNGKVTAQYIEIIRQGEEEDRIDNLPFSQQAAAWEREHKRRAAWKLQHQQSNHTPPTANGATTTAITCLAPSTGANSSSTSQSANGPVASSTVVLPPSPSPSPPKRLRWSLKLKKGKDP